MVSSHVRQSVCGCVSNSCIFSVNISTWRVYNGVMAPHTYHTSTVRGLCTLRHIFFTAAVIYQAEEGRTERQSDHPAAAASSTDHLHPVVASRFGRPLGRLQRALQPSAGVLPLVKQSVLLLVVVVVVVVLHAGETDVLLFHHGVSCGGRRHNVTCQSVTEGTPAAARR